MIRTFRAVSAISRGSSASLPGPNSIRGSFPNVNGIILPLAPVRRHYHMMSHAFPGFRHPRLHRLPPFQIMGRFLMRQGRRFGFIRLIQQKPAGIIHALQHVKPHIARLLYGIPVVFNAGRLKCFDMRLFDIHRHAGHDHNCSPETFIKMIFFIYYSAGTGFAKKPILFLCLTDRYKLKHICLQLIQPHHMRDLDPPEYDAHFLKQTPML